MPTKNEKKPKIHEIPIFSSERAVSRIHLFVEKTSLNNFLTPSLFGGSKLLLCSILETVPKKMRLANKDDNSKKFTILIQIA